MNLMNLKLLELRLHLRYLMNQMNHFHHLIPMNLKYLKNHLILKYLKNHLNLIHLMNLRIL